MTVTRVDITSSTSPAREATAVPEAPTKASAEWVGGTYSWSPDLGSTSPSRASVNMAEVGNGASGILGTATSPSGAPRLVGDLKPTDLVDVGGMRTTVQNAERMGLIHRDPGSGIYSEAGAKDTKAPPVAERASETRNTQEINPDVDQRLSTPGAEETISELVKATSAGAQVRALGQIINGGEVERNTLTALASEAGIHPDELSGKLTSVMTAFRNQADEVAKSVGVADVEDLWDWARTTKGADLRKAMSDQAMQRNTSGYRALAQQYVENMDRRNPEAILGAQLGNGISVKKAADGRIVVAIAGRGEVSWSTAVRSGLVKISPLNRR